MHLTLKLLKNLKIFIWIFFILLVHSTSAQVKNQNWNIKPSIGWQSTNFNWSIAGKPNGTSPNILSEVIWKGLKGMDYGLDVAYDVTERLRVDFQNQYSRLSQGIVTDTDYADDNRQNPFYDEYLNADKGYLFSSGLQVNYAVLKNKQFEIRPLAGLSLNEQKFYLLENSQSPTSVGLNSTYKTSYRGFDFGSGFLLKQKYFHLAADIIAGFYTYSAKANWNLIPAFAKPVSFIQKSNSFSLQTKLNLSVPLTTHLRADLNYVFKSIKTYTGVDRTYYVNDDPKETLFNGADFKQNALRIGVTYSF
ncbi:hypothetical protein [Pedobacter sp. MW01-1-1]|uniref:hypothetical protein n=1 Tax=Pedobacter sp. MW01-1-1 TaxID=3383027 RepID=UPI003FF14392